MKIDLRIQDPLYGIIELSEYERKIIDSPAFQRLLSVKQLGYAYAVFPGADYSRFSHSVGACSVMERLLQGLIDYGKYPLTEKDKQLYRFAILLHDVGHYPFSHPLEEAIKKRYTVDLTKAGEEEQQYLVHEDVSTTLIEEDLDIRKAIEAAGIDPAAVAAVIREGSPDKLHGLVSSDVDADRLDYLARTAHHTGLPYGVMDQGYLVHEVRVDENDELCWTRRSLGALDHLLVSRFYDYQQIVHNKTVVALEIILKNVVYALTDPTLGNSGIDLSKRAVTELIKQQKWCRFDDHSLFERIKAAQGVVKIPGEPHFADKCAALIDRMPARRVAECATFMDASRDAAFLQLTEKVENTVLPELAERFGIHHSLWWLWSNRLRITGYKGLQLPDPTDEATAGLVRVLSEGETNSRLAILDEQSLVRHLCTKWKFIARIYVLVARNHKMRSDIEKAAQAALDEVWVEFGLGSVDV